MSSNSLHSGYFYSATTTHRHFLSMNKNDEVVTKLVNYFFYNELLAKSCTTSKVVNQQV